MSSHYDVIIIGTGAGGGTLLHRLAPSGKKILVLERGPFLPREKDNWSYHGSFKYYSSNEAAMHLSPCIRCETCDGYPCLQVPPAPSPLARAGRARDPSPWAFAALDFGRLSFDVRRSTFDVRC